MRANEAEHKGLQQRPSVMRRTINGEQNQMNCIPKSHFFPITKQSFIGSINVYLLVHLVIFCSPIELNDGTSVYSFSGAEQSGCVVSVCMCVCVTS